MPSDLILINRRNVRTEVRHNVNACKKFFELEINSRVEAAAIIELKLKSFDDIPDFTEYDQH